MSTNINVRGYLGLNWRLRVPSVIARLSAVPWKNKLPKLSLASALRVYAVVLHSMRNATASPVFTFYIASVNHCPDLCCVIVASLLAVVVNFAVSTRTRSGLI